MASVDAAIATFERNIEAQTGLSVPDWVAKVKAQGLEKHGAMVAWLKAEAGLSHGHANHIAKRALEVAALGPDGDVVGHLFDGGKESLRPLYDQLAAAAAALGPDVELVPKKANVSVRRKRQFALLQPTTRGRLDLGLFLKDRPAAGRLEPSGSFNAMFTHRVRIAAPEDIDADVLAWLKSAYDEAG